MNGKRIKKRHVRTAICSTLYALIMTALFMGVIGLHQGRLFGHDLGPSAEERRPADVTLKHIKSIFPEATRFQKRENRFLIYDRDKEIGWGYSTSPAADSIVGYASAVPVLIGLDRSDRVVGVTLLDNAESPDFIEQIIASGFLDSWNALPINEALTVEVDAVTGATRSSDAIIQTVRHGIGTYLDRPVTSSTSRHGWTDLKTVLGLILLGLALLQFFWPGRLKRFRTAYQLLVVGILGFWSGTFLSMVLLTNWTINGIDLPARLFIFSILVAAIVLPLLTGKAFYCTYLCPYGAAQDLLGKIRKGPSMVPKRWRPFLSTLREKIFATLMVLLLSGISFDLTRIEPFSAFLFRSAALSVLILAVLFLAVSIFVPRPWCRYTCPTGHFLELIRKVNKP